MNLPNNWLARFNDITKTAICTKAEHKNRTVHFRWEPPVARAVDPHSGVARTDDAARLPPMAAAAFQAECGRRWG